jgi:hypothetical protein
MNSKLITFSLVFFVVLTIVRSEDLSKEVSNNHLLPVEPHMEKDRPPHRQKLSEIEIAQMKQMNEFQRSLHQNRLPNPHKFERPARPSPVNEI